MITLPTFPIVAFHPIHGRVTVNDLDQAAQTFKNPNDWFYTAAEADAHRHEGEAAIVIHNARRAQIARHEDEAAGVVKHSVTHQETVDRQLEQNDMVRESLGMEEDHRDGDLQGAELTS